jgi:hypothetical protein
MHNMTLSQLIATRMQELQIGRKQMPRRMGYKNPTKALRIFDAMTSGELDFKETEYKALSIALELSLDVVSQALQFSLEMIKDQVRANFKPYLCAMCENRVPSPIFAGCITQKQRFVYFDNDFLCLSRQEQFKLVNQAIVNHLQSKNGAIPAFGKILHYVLFLAPFLPQEQYLVFDLKGDWIENPAQGIERMHGVAGGLLLNGKRI